MNSQDYTRHWFAVRGILSFCSPHLLRQVAYSYETGGQEPDAIAQAISCNENGQRNGMKKADRFRRPPLKGLFKLHFQPTGGRSIGALVTNVLNETGHPMREKRMAALLEKYEEQVVDHRILHEVISEMLDGGLDDRSKRGRLTGDWVIFEKAGKTRRYLTIATHEERNDDQVYHRVIAARQEMDA